MATNNQGHENIPAIQEYKYLNEGINTTNNYCSNLELHRSEFERINSELNTDGVFEGPIARSSAKGYSELNNIMQDLNKKYTNFSEALYDYLTMTIELEKESGEAKENVILTMDQETGTFQAKKVYKLDKNLYVDPKTGYVFPIAQGEGRLDTTYGQYGTSSQGGYGGAHNGIDIVAAAGTNIHAASDSTVYYSGWDPWTHDGTGGYGYCVVLKDSAGNYQIYGHMQSNPGLTRGSKITSGQVIGKVGSSGNTPGGAHLHYEIRNGMTWNGDYSMGIGNYYSNLKNGFGRKSV